MTFCSESTCWFSSLILSSLAGWFTWTFLLMLLFSSELTSGLFWEDVPVDFSYDAQANRRYGVKCYIQVKAWYLTNKCQQTDQCYCFAQMQLQLSVLWLRCQQTPNLLIWWKLLWWLFKSKHMYGKLTSVYVFLFVIKTTWYIIYCAPCVSFSMKRLLSSVIPNILMHESMIFPTVVSFGVLRWTIRSDAATHDTTIISNMAWFIRTSVSIMNNKTTTTFI